jgi:hypothetical protein
MDVDREQALMVHYYSDRTYNSVTLTDAEMEKWKARKKPFAKTSGRFMYRSLVRIWLEITNIRAEQVQKISEEDCYKEGLTENDKYVEDRIKTYGEIKEEYIDVYSSMQDAFSLLWDSLHGKGAWHRNDWVWVREFKRI